MLPKFVLKVLQIENADIELWPRELFGEIPSAFIIHYYFYERKLPIMLIVVRGTM